MPPMPTWTKLFLLSKARKDASPGPKGTTRKATSVLPCAAPARRKQQHTNPSRHSISILSTLLAFWNTENRKSLSGGSSVANRYDGENSVRLSILWPRRLASFSSCSTSCPSYYSFHASSVVKKAHFCLLKKKFNSMHQRLFFCFGVCDSSLSWTLQSTKIFWS